MKRVNEFGFSAEMLEQKNKEKAAIGGEQAAIESEQAAIEGTEDTKTPADKKDD